MMQLLSHTDKNTKHFFSLPRIKKKDLNNHQHCSQYVLYGYVESSGKKRKRIKALCKHIVNLMNFSTHYTRSRDIWPKEEQNAE